MFIYYDYKDHEIFAIGEHQNLIINNDDIKCSEYTGEMPPTLELALFDGHKFYGRSDEEMDVIEQHKMNARNREYLRSTDWCVIRELETGTCMSTSVRQSRIDTRKQIMEIDEFLEMRNKVIQASKETLPDDMGDHGMKRV